jgi:hypothetical protein
MPQHARQVLGDSVILGGRSRPRHRALRPARRSIPARAPRPRRRRRGSARPERLRAWPFTWGRRHIESYLMVPDAIRRALDLPPHDRRVARRKAPPAGRGQRVRLARARRRAPAGAAGHVAARVGRPCAVGASRADPRARAAPGRAGVVRTGRGALASPIGRAARRSRAEIRRGRRAPRAAPVARDLRGASEASGSPQAAARNESRRAHRGHVGAAARSEAKPSEVQS